MSLEDLMKPMDTTVTVGVIQSNNTEIAVYMVDFGEKYLPMDDTMLRYKKITLDTPPSDNGIKYCVSSDKVVSEITSKHLDLMSEKGFEEAFREATSSGTPEFSSCVDVSLEAHERFQVARQSLDGYWVLVLLTMRATEVVLDVNDRVVRVTPKERNMYVSRSK